MTLAIMQPYLFPYLGYWQLIEAVDTFVIFDDVNFIKKSYINRNSILLHMNTHRFTLELKGSSQNKLIKELKVGENSKKILNTIRRAYSKSPYFNKVFPILQEILMNDEKNLSKFIGNSLETISNYLEIETNFIYSSKIKKNNNLKAEDKIIDICKMLNAKIYINSIGGKELYKNSNFGKNKIELNFLKPKDIKYPQFKSNFIPNLSIIDILMFNDIEEIKKMLNQYDLIKGT